MKTDKFKTQLTDLELQQILDAIPEGGTLVEWGCGGSTIKWLKRLNKSNSLYTIEHTDMWYKGLNDAINEDGLYNNVNTFRFLHIPTENVANPHYARPEEEMAAGATTYIAHPAVPIDTADVFFIDGIARGPILARLAVQAKSGSVAFLHDYKGRESWYDWAVELCNAAGHEVTYPDLFEPSMHVKVTFR